MDGKMAPVTEGLSRSRDVRTNSPHQWRHHKVEFTSLLLRKDLWYIFKSFLVLWAVNITKLVIKLKLQNTHVFSLYVRLGPRQETLRV